MFELNTTQQCRTLKGNGHQYDWIKVDESTLPNNETFGLIYLWRKKKSERCFLPEPQLQTLQVNLFSILSKVILKKKILLLWKLCLLLLIKAPEMVGRRRGFITILKREVTGTFLTVHTVFLRQQNNLSVVVPCYYSHYVHSTHSNKFI